eukprot:TRINITY_DN4724_c0_g1_i1.p1 TRINITY_DN4724_c0_g1~~TRINITY_DN4724_c0_g1_i1.p1  ORF type:complete len:278 (+),score=75.99 TRINITY_DN4724_c0_g1_i1:128-961(+)
MVAFTLPQEASHCEDALEISADFLAQGRRQIAKFKDDGEDDDSRLPMVACKTCPGTLEQLRNTEADSLDEQPHYAVAEAERAAKVETESKPIGPCLLLQQGRQNFKVKNTFIDGLASDDEEDEDRPPMIATKSCPQRACVEIWPPTPVREVSEIDDKPAELGAAMQAAASPAMIVPLEQRQPEHSEGAQLHGTGQCKPCAWYWRPQGCNNGPECGHCHLCTAAELKVRKKAKKHTQKLRSPGSESAESCVENESPIRFVPTLAFVQWPLAPGIDPEL